jgi:hypothetical protein
MSHKSNDSWDHLSDIDLDDVHTDNDQQKEPVFTDHKVPMTHPPASDISTYRKWAEDTKDLDLLDTMIVENSPPNAHTHFSSKEKEAFENAGGDITSIPPHQLSKGEYPQFGNQTSGITGERGEPPTYTANEAEIEYFRPKNTYCVIFCLV